MRKDAALILGLFFAVSLIDANISAPEGTRISDKLAVVQHVLSIGADRENEDFFNPSSFDIDKEGRIYLLDTGNCRVQVFSTDGRFIRSFGKQGQGPGELSKTAKKIKILDDGNVCIIDHLQKNINIYRADGAFISAIKTPKGIYDDIVKLNDEYLLSNTLLKPGNKPVHVLDGTGNIRKMWGTLLEPEEGLVERIAKEEDFGLDQFFCGIMFSSLDMNSRKEVIYSIRLPYKMAKYSHEGAFINERSGEADYGHQEKFVIFHQGSVPRMKANFPLPNIMPPIIRGDDSIIVPQVDKEKENVIFDLFDKDLVHKARYAMRNTIARKESKEYVRQMVIDEANFLYCLITAEDSPAQIRKYKISFVD